MPKINFKSTSIMTHQLNTALKKEKDKFQKCPIGHDLVHTQNVINAWGYVITGFFLVEQSFKALLNLRGKEPEKTHNLTQLFKELDEKDQSIIQEFYDDLNEFLEKQAQANKFPFSSLDSFLLNLDGADDKVNGSIDWRYFLIAERENKTMATVSVEHLHEIVFACIMILENHLNGTEPTQFKKSLR